MRGQTGGNSVRQISKVRLRRRPTTSMHAKQNEIRGERRRRAKEHGGKNRIRKKTYVGIAWVNVESLHN